MILGLISIKCLGKDKESSDKKIIDLLDEKLKLRKDINHNLPIPEFLYIIEKRLNEKLLYDKDEESNWESDSDGEEKIRPIECLKTWTPVTSKYNIDLELSKWKQMPL